MIMNIMGSLIGIRLSHNEDGMNFLHALVSFIDYSPVLDMNYSISVSLDNIAKSTVCFCWTNLVSVIEVANSNVK